MSSKIILSTALILLGSFFLVAGIYSFSSPPQLLSPVALSNPAPVSTPPQQYQIIGFLPYWLISSFDPSTLDHLTDLIFFSLEPDRSGDLITAPSSQEAGLGWRWLNKSETQTIFSLARQKNVKLHVVIKLFDTSTIQALTTDTTSQANFISSLTKLVADQQLNGINLDFEPNTPIDASTSAAFTHLLSSLKRSLQQTSPPASLTLDVLGKAGEDSYTADLSNWHPYLDSIIVMTYDYHQSNSSVAGPVSPLYAPLPKHSIIRNLHSLTTQVPAQKIILGIPFYGYRWQTTSDQFLSLTYPNSGSVIFYRQIIPLISQSQTIYNFSSDSLTPWLLQTQNDEFFQIHFEDPRSIGIKINLIRSAGLAGAAIWALGYEGDQTQIWQPFTLLHPPN